MRTRMYHLIAAVAALTAPAPAAAETEYEARDFLPLAVGNSWTLGHEVQDWRHLDPEFYGPAPTWSAWEDSNGVFTLTVERTEEIEGNTYYVLSGMPSPGWPPPPPNFIAGKKLRWAGARLMEQTGAGEEVLYDWSGISIQDPARPVPEMGFRSPVSAGDYAGWGLEERYGDYGDLWRAKRYVLFLAGFGLSTCSEEIGVSDYGIYANEINAIEAVLIENAEGASGASGPVVRRVRSDEARKGLRGSIVSSVSSSSWGQVKGSGR